MNQRDRDQRAAERNAYGSEHPKQANPFYGSRQSRQWQPESDHQAGGAWDQGSSRPDDYVRDRSNSAGERATPRQGEYMLDREGRRTNNRETRDLESNYIDQHYDAPHGGDFTPFTSEDFGGRDFYASRTPASGMSSSNSYRSTFGPNYGPAPSERASHPRNDREYGDWRAYGEKRGFVDRASDEVASWFGDGDAARRREMDHRGRGPADYVRSDDRVLEDANDELTHDRHIDARNITVRVASGEVTLDGTVDSRRAKRHAEDLVEGLRGVKHVQNNLRVAESSAT